MRSFLSIGLLIIAARGFAAPKILIVQPSDDPKAPIASQTMMGDYLAMALAQGAKTIPIVYGMTDPLFRTAVLDGVLKTAPDNPTLAQAIEVGRALGADYVLACKAVMKGGELRASANLYRGGRAIWHDDANLGIKIGEKESVEDAARSIASTWNSKLGNGPFKTAVTAPVAVTPDPTAGQTPETTPVAPPTSKVDDEGLRKQLDSLLAAGQTLDALLAARDAVDEDPLDIPRRRLLVKVLQARGEARPAADELQRGADLHPEDAELRLAAARAWLDLKDFRAAKLNFNEVVARNPSSPSTRLLLGELELIQGEPENALPHLDAAIKAEPAFGSLFERAICRALLGGLDGMNTDLGEAAKQKPPSKEEARRLGGVALQAFDQASGQAIEDIKTLISHAGIKPNDVAVRDDLESFMRQAKSRKGFLDAVAIVPELKDARNRFALVQSLLVQSLLAVQSFVAAGTDDDLTDARINVGEAVKQLVVAREALAKAATTG